jgi:hypothetical protein
MVDKRWFRLCNCHVSVASKRLGHRRKLYSCKLVFEIDTVSPPPPCHTFLCLCITYRFYLQRKICGVHFVKRKVCDHGVVCVAFSTNSVSMTVPVRCIMDWVVETRLSKVKKSASNDCNDLWWLAPYCVLAGLTQSLAWFCKDPLSYTRFVLSRITCSDDPRPLIPVLTSPPPPSFHFQSR